MIALEYATPTALSSTTKTQLNGDADVVLPSWAKSILAVSPVLASAGMTVDETIIAKMTIESAELNVSPFELIFDPIGGGLGTETASLASKIPKYPLNLACKGGERLQVYGTGLINNTIEPYAGAVLVLSDAPPSRPQTKAKVGTLTTCGTANVETAGSNVEISGARKLSEVYGVVSPTGVTITVEGTSGYFRLASADFLKPLPLKFPAQPCGGAVGTGLSILIDGIARFPVDVPCSQRTVIEDYCTMVDTQTTAPQFIVGVLYE